jgi:hypothetical protein
MEDKKTVVAIDESLVNVLEAFGTLIDVLETQPESELAHLEAALELLKQCMNDGD